MTAEILSIDTPVGPSRLWWQEAAQKPYAVLILGHGAGGQIDAVDLAALAAELPQRGISVGRYEQPWRTAGRKISAPEKQLDQAFATALAEVRARVGSDLPIFSGGRSQGARIACRTAGDSAVAGVVCLAFPLHPPGKPDKSRLSELVGSTAATLVFQGTRDTFGTSTLLETQLAQSDSSHIRVIEVPGGDHGMKVRKSDPLDPAGVATLLSTTTETFVREHAA